MLDAIETRIPPPLVMLVCGLLAWCTTHHASNSPTHSAWLTIPAMVIGPTGLALNLLPKLQFKRAGTTVNPLTPGRASQLVTQGVYAYTRNPMYLGQACLLLSWCLWLQHALAPLSVVMFMAYITRFQILPEERMLAQKFPAEFALLCQRTRRWL